jgi:hypothetical protein
MAQCTVGTDLIVVTPPSPHKRCRFQERVEYLPVQQRIRGLSDERFHVAVLPETGFLNVQCTHRAPIQPALRLLRHELRSVVAAEVFRCTSYGKQILKRQDHITRGERPAHLVGRRHIWDRWGFGRR